MDIYTRVENLEKLIDKLIKQMNRQKIYTDADVGGVRKGNNDNYSEIQNVREDASNTENVVDSVMTETIPSLVDSNEQLQATIDMIMTDIIPNIIDTSTETK